MTDEERINEVGLDMMYVLSAILRTHVLDSELSGQAAFVLKKAMNTPFKIKVPLDTGKAVSIIPTSKPT